MRSKRKRKLKHKAEQRGPDYGHGHLQAIHDIFDKAFKRIAAQLLKEIQKDENK